MTSIRDHRKKSPHRTRLERLLQRVLPTLSGSVLDIGSRNRRYDHLLPKPPVALDLVENTALDVQFGDVLDLKFSGSTFDAVLCLEVLEYVTDPKRAISELRRVLKDNGTLVLSVPFMIREHEDKQRYTGEYLKSLLADFDIQEFVAVGGASTVMLNIWWGKVKAARHKFVRAVGTALLMPLLLLRSSSFSETPYASGYFIVAKKRP